MSERDQIELFLWILYAMGLGALVGLEREFRGHEAGMRTTALVCAGAAVFGQVSEAFGDSRIAAGVVQGIGFENHQPSSRTMVGNTHQGNRREKA
jgi:putative Mg2+ transporter-C (MgtC) family protein